MCGDSSASRSRCLSRSTSIRFSSGSAAWRIFGGKSANSFRKRSTGRLLVPGDFSSALQQPAAQCRIVLLVERAHQRRQLQRPGLRQALENRLALRSGQLGAAQRFGRRQLIDRRCSRPSSFCTSKSKA